MSSMLRLAVFCLGIMGIYWFFNQGWLPIAIAIIGIALFLFLVSKHADLTYKSSKLEKLITICDTEIKVLDHDYRSLPEGREFQDPAHPFSEDIDLFGPGSFYQYMNRTALAQGSLQLAQWLTENSIDSIPEKQDAFGELAGMPEWRQDFMATAGLALTQVSTAAIEEWQQRYSRFVPKSMRYLPALFSTISIALSALYLFSLIPFAVLIIWLSIGLGITMVFSKQISRLLSSTAQMEDVCRQYSRLLEILEQTPFSSVWLQNEKKDILGTGSSARQLKGFADILNSLDRNINPIYLFLANGFFLRTLANCHSLERWVDQYGPQLTKWFRVIARFDASISLANFAFNHPAYSFPELSREKFVIRASKLGHPLLRPELGVPNDFEISQQQFYIITGANMSGKSTFLRSVGLNLVMANVGLPVCARQAEFIPMKLISSMRTRDSLADDTSYFLSEIKRLKFIVEQLENAPYFVILDEILKGTNSTDKSEGSKKFVKRLISMGATGLIATHDLSICGISQEESKIENYYFDTEIEGDELYFDFSLKEGICRNMNASFLLRKMGIIEP